MMTSVHLPATDDALTYAASLAHSIGEPFTMKIEGTAETHLLRLLSMTIDAAGVHLEVDEIGDPLPNGPE